MNPARPYPRAPATSLTIETQHYLRAKLFTHNITTNNYIRRAAGDLAEFEAKFLQPVMSNR